MMDNANINSISDNGIVANMGSFIKHHRLEQNKTQRQLAEEAGINRTTLVEFEKGTGSNIITLIQLLRALNLLHVLEKFKVDTQVSPIQLAEMEQAKRKRASRSKTIRNKNKSDW